MSQLKDRAITYNFPHLGGRRSNLDTAFVLESHLVKGSLVACERRSKARERGDQLHDEEGACAEDMLLILIARPRLSGRDGVLTRIITSLV